ncbi:PREDICTED: uncharacterized protein LOC107104593, partial [Cyprinodon variegatus]|uniref:uncharacterized protein LOC107104593 n=1 Tax=Cyprinodon variegatus TaxID=28743 RepID=UPI0007426FE7
DMLMSQRHLHLPGIVKMEALAVLLLELTDESDHHHLVPVALQAEDCHRRRHDLTGSSVRKHLTDSSSVKTTARGGTVTQRLLHRLHYERYNIVLIAAVDGYSRKVMCLEAATNNRAQTAFAAFEKATEKYGIPSRVRADQGVENVEIAHYMFTVRGSDGGSFISGKSVHNQRIERLWRDVRTCVTSKYYSLLHNLETDHLLDISSRG